MMMTSNCHSLEQAQSKLNWALTVAREATLENQSLKEELDSLLLESDRLKLQLEQKKTQLALMEEKKAENELQMKREIKSLLEAYLQVKQRLEEIEGVQYDEEGRGYNMMRGGRYGMVLWEEGRGYKYDIHLVLLEQ